MKKYLYTINTGAILAIVLLLFGIMGCITIDRSGARARSTGTREYDLRFGVISDTHLEYNGWVGSTIFPNSQRFEKVLAWYNTKDVKALAIVGDITDTGSQNDWDYFINSWEKHKGKLQLISVMGNHEVSDSDKNVAADRFEAATDQKTNAHYVINGYHFIVLSAGTGAFIDQGAVGGAIASGRNEIPGSLSSGDNVSQSVREWARNRIDIAKADAPGKPIFMFLHWPIRNTFYGSETGCSSFGDDPLTGFFKDDPEIIIFGAHAHRPNNDPRAIWQGGFTSINVPPMFYIGLGGRTAGYLGDSVDGVENGQYPKIPYNIAGQGIVVSVTSSKVTIENYDFDLTEGPLRPLSGVEKIPQTWNFDVSCPEEFPYTQVIRNEQKTTPVFYKSEPTNTSFNGIIINTVNATSVEIEFPQAKIPEPNYGNEIVFSYRFDFINQQTGIIDRSARQFSDFMLTPRLQKPTYTQLIGGLEPGTEYELRIYAYGSFQECSGQYLV